MWARFITKQNYETAFFHYADHVLTEHQRTGQRACTRTGVCLTTEGDAGRGLLTGGTFEGPNIKGTIISGGADYQLANANGRTEVEAIYCIKTDDGVYIHVRNRGIIANSKDANGNPSFYFRCAPQFEAPADSKYGWLNNSLFLCAPSFSGGFNGITLNVWRVK